MGHPAIDNQTPYAVAPSYAADEQGRPLLVVLVQATFALVAGPQLVLAEEQRAPSLPGVLWGADAATSSYKIEPAVAFTKVATDVVLVGHARSAQPTPEVTVALRVGPLGKAVRVLGNRIWRRSGGQIQATAPVPFFAMPLVYERAFGGWDCSDRDPAKHGYEPRNPVGVGYRVNAADARSFEEGIALPNLEDPADPIRSFGQSVTPAGFGFVSPGWQPRAQLAGAHDATWAEQRMPLVPTSFDRRFFNAASPGLVAPGYLRGDESVVIDNASPMPRLSFRLPGVPQPRVRVELRGRGDAERVAPLDTVVLNTDENEVLLMHRAHVPLDRGPHDVRTIEVA